MRINHHERERRSSFRTRLVLVVSVVAGLLLAGAGQSAARAGTSSTSGKTQVVRVTQNVAALVVENLCNADTVDLHGQLVMTTATTPTSNGGLRIVSSVRANNLTGKRIAPLPGYGYVGSDNQDSYSYIAPPPYPTTYSERHWTKLVPQVNAPAMWLVVVTREVITADGTALPAVERAYLSCSQPTSRDCHRES
jgi:hypothetical protein